MHDINDEVTILTPNDVTAALAVSNVVQCFALGCTKPALDLKKRRRKRGGGACRVVQRCMSA